MQSIIEFLTFNETEYHDDLNEYETNKVTEEDPNNISDEYYFNEGYYGLDNNYIPEMGI